MGNGIWYSVPNAVAVDFWTRTLSPMAAVILSLKVPVLEECLTLFYRDCLTHWVHQKMEAKLMFLSWKMVLFFAPWLVPRYCRLRYNIAAVTLFWAEFLNGMYTCHSEKDKKCYLHYHSSQAWCCCWWSCSWSSGCDWGSASCTPVYTIKGQAHEINRG